MCYAIPGKVLEINNGVVTVDYFGERKKAKNEFYNLRIGDYIYAQGGFVIQKISPIEAIPILETWKELFFKLQQIDFNLARETKNLYQRANNLRQKYHGNSCCIHGIIEFSNYCRCDCLYCGIRKSNGTVLRYRMDIDEIVEAVGFAVRKLGFKALVLQSGEDIWYDEEKLALLISKIMGEAPCLIVLSIGEREIEVYERLYQLGARGLLLRFETGNEYVYEKMRPGHILKERLSLINKLRQIGYLIMTGFLIGLPGQTKEDILSDIKRTASLGAEMFSFGPFIPHPQTPLANIPSPSIEDVLETIANVRLMNPGAKILVNTSFETLDKENAVRLGLMAGANSLMINVTPERYRKLYDIYPSRAGIDLKIVDRINSIVSLLHSIGRAPTDLGLT
ncbi:MAG: radical SAM protein [Candidatus Omnitrophica bacterium]|nr:radical SAM protein [Candidatus Omnitrophota bacterium]